MNYRGDRASVLTDQHLVSSNGFNTMHECNAQTDRRTDSATVTAVAIGELAFSSAAQPLT